MNAVITVTFNPAIDKTITLDQLEIGGLNRVNQARIDPGGKGVNVAKVLNQFDVNVTATGFIAGQQGTYLENQLKKRNINTLFHEVNGETRTNLKIVDEQTNVTTEINESGFNVSLEDIEAFKQELVNNLGSESILVLSGSLPAGAPSTVYQEIIEMANAKGAKVILDADGEALKNGIVAKPYAIKPNIHELEQLVDKTLASTKDIIDAGREFLELGIEILIISMGENGSIIMTENEAYQVSPFPIVPKSTVGAGDSMVATLVYSLLQQKDIKEIGSWTTTAGTITASKPGTEVCTLKEVQENVEKVSIQKIY